jgi:carboxyl-terminal processing protease
MKSATFRSVRFNLYPFLIVLFVILLLPGCKDKNSDQVISSEDSIYVYIDRVMNSWYYWYDEVPQVDIFHFDTPADLLDTLIYKPLDRWSFIDNAESIGSLFEEGKTFGFGFLIRFDPENNLRVIYVYENSDAYEQGIRKANIIEKINGLDVQTLDTKYFDPFFDDSPASWDFDIIDNDSIERNITITKASLVQNAVFMKKVFENVGGKNVGYLAYEDFLGYGKPELEEAFDYFKSNSIDELIVDLRYNLGGYVSLAKEMSEIIAPASTENEIFTTYSHNDLISSYEDTTMLFAHQELNLNLKEIFFITTRFSASASELVMNSLAPYMKVFLIGSPTHGKPVGMYGFQFQDWLLYPISFKLLNADGYGDYFNGLPVDAAEGEGLDKDWGDITDPNIAQALYYIENGAFNTAKGAVEQSPNSGKLADKMLTRKNTILLNR